MKDTPQKSEFFPFLRNPDFWDQIRYPSLMKKSGRFSVSVTDLLITNFLNHFENATKRNVFSIFIDESRTNLTLWCGGGISKFLEDFVIAFYIRTITIQIPSRIDSTFG